MNDTSPKVTQHLQSLPPHDLEIIAYLRSVFLSADAEIAEHIKWNSLSFYYNGSMKAFDPKTYQRDLAVLHAHRGKILIVFPTGSKIDAQTGLQGKNYPDGRNIVEITDLADAKNKSVVLAEGIKNWLAQIDK